MSINKFDRAGEMVLYFVRKYNFLSLENKWAYACKQAERSIPDDKILIFREAVNQQLLADKKYSREYREYLLRHYYFDKL